MDEVTTNTQQAQAQPLNENVGVPDVGTAAWNTEATVQNGQVQATTVGATGNYPNIASGITSTPIQYDTSGMTQQGQAAVAYQQQYQQALNDQTIQNYQNAFNQSYQSQVDANGQIDQTYQQSAQDISNQYAIYRQNMGMNIANQGLNTGLGSQMQLSLTNSRNNSLARNSVAHAQAVQAGQQALVDLELQYRTAIAEAIGNNDLTLAQSLYEEIQNDENRKLVIAQTMAQYGDYSGYQEIYGSETATAMQEAYDKAKQESKNIENIEYLAQLGDFSGLADYYDWTDEQYADATAQWIYANPGYAYYIGKITADQYYAITGQLPTTGTVASSSSGGGYSSSGGGGGDNTTTTNNTTTTTTNTTVTDTGGTTVNASGSTSTTVGNMSGTGGQVTTTYTDKTTGASVTKGTDGKYYDASGKEVSGSNVVMKNSGWNVGNSSNYEQMTEEENAAVVNYMHQLLGHKADPTTGKYDAANEQQAYVYGKTTDNMIAVNFGGRDYLMDIDPLTGSVTMYDKSDYGKDLVGYHPKTDANGNAILDANGNPTYEAIGTDPYSYTDTDDYWMASELGMNVAKNYDGTTSSTTPAGSSTPSNIATTNLANEVLKDGEVPTTGNPVIDAAIGMAAANTTNIFDRADAQAQSEALAPFVQEALDSLAADKANGTSDTADETVKSFAQTSLIDLAASAVEYALNSLGEMGQTSLGTTGKFIGVNPDQYRPAGTAASQTVEEAGGNVQGLGGKDSLGNEGYVTSAGQNPTTITADIGIQASTDVSADGIMRDSETGELRSKSEIEIAAAISLVTGSDTVTNEQIAYAIAVKDQNPDATIIDIVEKSKINRTAEEIQQILAHNEETKQGGFFDYIDKVMKCDTKPETVESIGAKIDIQKAWETGNIAVIASAAVLNEPNAVTAALMNVRNHMWDTAATNIESEEMIGTDGTSDMKSVMARWRSIQEDRFGDATDSLSTWAFNVEMELEWVLGSQEGLVTNAVINLFMNTLEQNLNALGPDATPANYQAAIDGALILVGSQCNPNFKASDYKYLYNYKFDYVTPYTIDKADENYMDYLTAGYGNYHANDVVGITDDQWNTLMKALGLVNDDGTVNLKGAMFLQGKEQGLNLAEAKKELFDLDAQEYIKNAAAGAATATDINKNYGGKLFGSGYITDHSSSSGGLSTGVTTETQDKSTSRSSALQEKIRTDSSTRKKMYNAMIENGYNSQQVANLLNNMGKGYDSTEFEQYLAERRYGYSKNEKLITIGNTTYNSDGTVFGGGVTVGSDGNGGRYTGQIVQSAADAETEANERGRAQTEYYQKMLAQQQAAKEASSAASSTQNTTYTGPVDYGTTYTPATITRSVYTNHKANGTSW